MIKTSSSKSPLWQSCFFLVLGLSILLTHCLNFPLYSQKDFSHENFSNKEQNALIKATKPRKKLKIYLDIVSNRLKKFKTLANFPNSTLIKIDGIRIEFENGWGLLRASNTTPNLVLRFEADSQEDLEEISNNFREILSKIDSDLAHF